MNRIGIMGGTFDPPHNGHLLIANEVLTKLDLTEIWFMPNNIPPHKDQKTRVSNAERLKLLSIAIQDNPKFKVQPIELERQGRSYSYDTMMILTKQYPDTKFFFIIGGDMVEYLPKWYKIEELIQLVSFVGVKRPGYSFTCPYPIIEVDVPQFDISSTMIRKRLKEKTSTMYLLSNPVREYIEEKHLYGT